MSLMLLKVGKSIEWDDETPPYLLAEAVVIVMFVVVVKGDVDAVSVENAR